MRLLTGPTAIPGSNGYIEYIRDMHLHDEQQGTPLYVPRDTHIEDIVTRFLITGDFMEENGPNAEAVKTGFMVIFNTSDHQRYYLCQKRESGDADLLVCGSLTSRDLYAYRYVTDPRFPQFDDRMFAREAREEAVGIDVYYLLSFLGKVVGEHPLVANGKMVTWKHWNANGNVENMLIKSKTYDLPTVSSELLFYIIDMFNEFDSSNTCLVSERHFHQGAMLTYRRLEEFRNVYLQTEQKRHLLPIAPYPVV